LQIAKPETDRCQKALLCIEEKATALTRRSAGLPAMITGILVAQPSGTFFDKAILKLESIAKLPVESPKAGCETRLPQVHALNCLKDIFTNTRLGSATEPYLANFLAIATDCLRSNTYVIATLPPFTTR
jgi:hypothetical protein